MLELRLNETWMAAARSAMTGEIAVTDD